MKLAKLYHVAENFIINKVFSSYKPKSVLKENKFSGET